MLNYMLISISGWLLMILLIALVVYPFLLRKGLLGPVQPFLKRMRIHYWLGYSLVAVLLLHVFESMTAKIMGSANVVGLDLATLAFFLVFIQVLLGRNLSHPEFSFRRLARRWHFWLMFTIVGFVLGHIVLNSGTIRMLVSR